MPTVEFKYGIGDKVVMVGGFRCKIHSLKVEPNGIAYVLMDDRGFYTGSEIESQLSPDRPEPKFKVGQTVNVIGKDLVTKSVTKCVWLDQRMVDMWPSDWHGPGWYYSRDDNAVCWPESMLEAVAPPPKVWKRGDVARDKTSYTWSVLSHEPYGVLVTSRGSIHSVLCFQPDELEEPK